MARTWLTRLLVVTLVPAAQLLAQGRPGPPPPLPFDVGSAVLLATNSIQVDRDCRIVSGDLVVNNASIGPVYGEKDLSIDQGNVIAAGYALKADSIDIDTGAIINGKVYVNTLQNSGALNGEVISPLSLPVTAMPQLPPGATAGTANVNVPNNQTQILGTGQYANLSVGRGATLRLGGGPYTFVNVTMERDSSLIWDGPGELMILGRLSLGASASILSSPTLTTKHKMIFVYAGNGGNGSLQASPSAVTIGRDCKVHATVLAPNGSIDVDQGAAIVGALIGRDIHIGRGSSLEVRSGFRNLPPVAQGQELDSNGPITITLTGFDPDGDPLQFSIVLPPSGGALSPLTPAGPTSAIVTYTPTTPGAPDAFVFRVSDAEGFIASAAININGGTPPPPPVNTVVVDDQSVTVPQNQPSILSLFARAPQGVPLTFAIVPGTGPTHGSLGPLMQPSQQPPLPARVPYAPQPNFAGTDSFQFSACGVIAGNQVCDSGTLTINVQAPPTDPGELAPDISVSVAAGTPSTIILPTPPPTGGPSAQSTIGRLTLVPTAVFLNGAAVAGNVADANGDGLGDNHNALPGPVPGLMSAGVGQTGGAGSNGTTRMQFEWDITGLAAMSAEISSANILLHTNRGTLDSAPTTFFFGVEPNDGQLTDDDYQTPSEPIARVSMPVPPNQQVGADGVFSFNVLEGLREAMDLGLTHLTLQGRIDETQAGPARGLQVYTSAAGNLQQHFEPQLSVITGAVAARAYRVTSLPSFGTLRDSNGVLITSVPYLLPSTVLIYHPGTATGGTTSFGYSVTDGPASDTGLVSIRILGGGDCATDPAFCNGGRD